MNDNESKTEVVRVCLEKNFKTGTAKTGKPWALHKYQTNSGIEFTSFDDLEPGDTAKLTYNSEYNNWSGGRIRRADTQHDEVMAALRKLYALTEATYEAVTGEKYKEPGETKRIPTAGVKTYQAARDKLKGSEEDDLNNLFPPED